METSTVCVYEDFQSWANDSSGQMVQLLGVVAISESLAGGYAIQTSDGVIMCLPKDVYLVVHPDVQ